MSLEIGRRDFVKAGMAGLVTSTSLAAPKPSSELLEPDIKLFKAPASKPAKVPEKISTASKDILSFVRSFARLPEFKKTLNTYRYDLYVSDKRRRIDDFYQGFLQRNGLAENEKAQAELKKTIDMVTTMPDMVASLKLISKNRPSQMALAIYPPICTDGDPLQSIDYLVYHLSADHFMQVKAERPMSKNELLTNIYQLAVEKLEKYLNHPELSKKIPDYLQKYFRENTIPLFEHRTKEFKARFKGEKSKAQGRIKLNEKVVANHREIFFPTDNFVRSFRATAA